MLVHGAHVHMTEVVIQIASAYIPARQLHCRRHGEGLAPGRDDTEGSSEAIKADLAGIACVGSVVLRTKEFRTGQLRRKTLFELHPGNRADVRVALVPRVDECRVVSLQLGRRVRVYGPDS